MNVQCHACIGGTNVGEDIRKLDYGQHVVAGTPGRVFGKRSVWTCCRRWRPGTARRVSAFGPLVGSGGEVSDVPRNRLKWLGLL